MSNPYNSATDRASVLGPTLYFKGDLSAEEDLLIQEYKTWLDENRTSQLVLAIRIPDTKAFSDEREVRRMEEESVMRLGKKKVKMTGHFPPSPVLRSD